MFDQILTKSDQVLTIYVKNMQYMSKTFNTCRKLLGTSFPQSQTNYATRRGRANILGYGLVGRGILGCRVESNARQI